MGILSSIGTLLDFALSIYSWLVLIRVFLSWVNPDPYNPIVQFLMRTTEPVLEPLRRRIPHIAGMDISPIVALLGISLLRRLIAGLTYGGMESLLVLLVEILGLLHILLTLYLILLLARGGLHAHAWFSFRRASPYRLNLDNKVIRFIFQSTEPVVRPMRRWVPTFSGMDITPVVASFGVIFLLSFIQDTLLRFASQ